jgi:hypothetical protein
MKIFELKPIFIELVPELLQDGVIYISVKYCCAVHLCACGCGKKTVSPLNSKGWILTKNNNKISLRPSIGNFKWETPYHAHYYITDNKIEWL